MTNKAKHKDAFRKCTITFLMLVLGSCAVLSQVTKQQLDNFYKNNNLKELEQTFFNLHHQTTTAFSKLSDNDTLNRINEIFNLILPDKEKFEPVAYFFLQPYYPRTFIDDKEYTFTSQFLASTKIENLKPIQYDYQTISELLKFIGSYPDNNPVVKKYLKNKKKMKKSKIRKAERLIHKYDNKSSFIGQFVHLPATWGRMNRSLVPYKINILRFNADLTEVEVIYDLTSSGATEVYTFVDGKWKLNRTIIQWIH
ncbi:MAG TPA: hypothetical protein VK168_06505 [Saprospiraceae bacterium]|nr:hypothetical protein [Saprospiraceae bacterium]